MIDLFYTGGPLFMGILTIILIVVMALAVYIFFTGGKTGSREFPITLVKEIGLFGLVVGVFGHFLGLYQAFLVIEEMGSIAPTLLFSGLKVASITTVYGLFICIIGWLLYFGLKAKITEE